MVSLMLNNNDLNVNVTHLETGVNSFWLASYYGHGNVMKLFAEKDINIFSIHSVTGNNALHTAVIKDYPNIIKMLVKSKYPLDLLNNEGLSALAMASMFENKLHLV